MGVSPYAQHASNRSQDATPYDTATPNGAGGTGGGSGISPKSASLYSPLSDSSSYVKGSSTGANGADCGTNGVGGAGTPSSVGAVGGAGGGSVTPKDQQNGYGSLSKDLNSWGGGAAGAGQTPVRPSVCTPDMSASRYTPTAVDVAARDRWMNTCSLSSAAAASQAAAAQPQLQQSANHHFYPWMAIAGTSSDNSPKQKMHFWNHVRERRGRRQLKLHLKILWVLATRSMKMCAMRMVIRRFTQCHARPKRKEGKKREVLNGH